MSDSQKQPTPTQAALHAAIENGDFSKFNEQYREFLSGFAGFRAAFSSSPTEVQAHNPIFGHKGFFLKQTNDTQADRLLEAARQASKVLGAIPVADRLQLLQILEEKIGQYQDAITTTITADTGKPIDLSYGEIAKGNEWFSYARDELVTQLGNTHIGRLTNRAKPAGAVQVIGAYNYPYALACSGIIGGLAAGNGVIVSAPLKAPNWVFPFDAAAQEAVAEFVAWAKQEHKPYADRLDQVKSGIVQHSVGVNTHLTKNADVVHFVGGDKVGEMIRVSRGHKPTIPELGGSNVVTVMQSALYNQDAARIAEIIYNGFGPATGQRCTAPRFICVQDGAQAVTDALKALCDQGPQEGEIGNPFKRGIKMGPLVDRGAHQKMVEAIALARELGAEVHGHLAVSNNIVPLAGSPDSYWVNPIVIDWSKVDMSNPENVRRLDECFSHEIFGPLVHIVHPVKTLDEAIETAKKLDTHNLAGAIFTNNEEDVARYEQELDVTSLAVNAAPKDQSPRGPHGHPGRPKIGGPTHFGLYSDRGNTAGNAWAV